MKFAHFYGVALHHRVAERNLAVTAQGDTGLVANTDDCGAMEFLHEGSRSFAWRKQVCSLAVLTFIAHQDRRQILFTQLGSSALGVEFACEWTDDDAMPQLSLNV